jgi:hypothetical protein
MLRRSLSAHVYTPTTTLTATFFAHSFVSLFLPVSPGNSVYDIRVWQNLQMLSLCHLSGIKAHTSMLHASHNPCTLGVIDWIRTSRHVHWVMCSWWNSWGRKKMCWMRRNSSATCGRRALIPLRYRSSTTVLKVSRQKHRSWQLYNNEKNGLQQIQMESCQPTKRIRIR